MPQNQNRDQIEPGDGGNGGGGDNEDDNVINSQDSRQGLNRDNCQDLKSSNSDKRTNRLPQASGSSASLRSQELVDGLTNNTRGQPEAAPTRRQSAANNQLSPSPRPTFELTSSPSSSSSARIELGSDEEGGESPASTAIQHHHMDANNNAGHIALDVAGDNRPAEAREQQQRLSRSPRPAQDNRQARVYSVNSTNTQTTSCDEPSSCAGNLDKPGLLYCSREPLKLKDFRIEVRAPMDVEQFCHQAELLLDLGETSMNGIIEAMLAKVAKNDGIGSEKLEEIRRSIFIPGSAVLMARTIHGFYTATDNQDHQQTSAALSHDQSWLCALCNLSQVSKRHMVFARFKQPINMGENAHEVRLFVLIVVPAKEKSTKDQVETGRTFGSMLTDADFRQRLLRARDEIEFKALMMAKAQQMARAHRLKNRHKYRLDPILNESISSVSLYDGQADDPLFHMKSVHSEPGGRGDRNNVNDEGDDGDRDEEDCDDNDEDNEHVFDSSTGDEPILVSSKSLNNLGDGSVGGIGSNNNSSSKSEDGLKARLTSFHRNPRTSKLFELINSNGSADAGASKKGGVIRGVPIQLGSLDTSKLRELEEIEKWNSGWRGVLSGLNLKFGQGAWDDFRRRLKYYASDFKDAFVGPPRTIQKTVATIWFLYFGILLPTIAFSSLNTIQTHGHMGDLRKAIIGQAIGGLGFALLGGQPLVIIMTTAPLCLYTRVIHQMCLDYGFPFPAMYAAVGLWNGLFLVVYSLFGFSELMKWCTRSTEEIFALFIVVAFVTDAGKDLVKNFKRFYFAPACEAQDNRTMAVMTDANRSMLAVLDPSSTANLSSTTQVYRDIEEEIESSVCRRETSLLFVLLMLGTLWLAITLYRFRRTPYLSQAKREALADYALPTAVILMSLIGSTVFDNIYVEKFPPLLDLHFEWARIDLLPWTGVLTSMGLGFTLSLLFFMDQNISAAMVMAPQNRLKKGAAYHYDLLIVGLLNGALTLYGLPMMHGVLPHSPLHARSLADIEERIEEGHLREVVVNSRETRVTAIVAHILVLLSLFLIPYPIAYIPRAVLNGLFLYMAVTSLDGLQVFERILLLVTEQNKYPPNHYIRRCPQRKIHQFTLLQICQLAIMCLFGFSPITIVEMLFPVLILLMIPFRHTIIPKYIEEKYLDALDGKGH